MTGWEDSILNLLPATPHTIALGVAAVAWQGIDSTAWHSKLWHSGGLHMAGDRERMAIGRVCEAHVIGMGR